MFNLPYSLGQISGLGLLWTSLSGAYVIKGIYQTLAGTSAGRDFDGEKGLLRFTKRPIRRMFIGLGIDGAICLAVYNSYCFGITNFGWLHRVITRVSDLDHVPSTDELSVLLGSTLLFTHTVYRLYQSVYINVFSNRTTQDLLDWLAPHLYTFLAGVTILSEAPHLDGRSISDWFDWHQFSWHHALGLSLFAFLTYHDHALQFELAKFRKNRAGHVVSEDHKLPKGGFFEWVSSPHFFTEILIHEAIGFTLGFHHKSWWILTGYVTISQVVRALGRQQWYRKKFEAMPPGRKAIVPFIL